MKHIYKQNLKILSSQTDSNTELGLVQSLALAQDNMCEYFKHIDCDGIAMIPTKGCFFVLAKTVIEFYGSTAKWLENISLSTQLCNKTKIKLCLETDFQNSSGENFATCAHEMCAMDAQSRNVRLLNSTSLPEDIEITKEQSLVFSKFDVDEMELKCEVTKRVDINNIDMYKHVNNLEYVKFMLSLLDMDFLETKKVKKFEIHYIAESRFADELTIKCYESDNQYVFMIYNHDKLINRGILNFDNK